MHRTLLNDGWEVRPKLNTFAELTGGGTEWASVTLPHDAMLGTERDESAGPANAYFPGGDWEYRRTITGPEPGGGEAIEVEFEGVYRDAVVRVNDTVAGRRPYGYSCFTVPIDHLLRPGDNELRVEAQAHHDSRWYSGAGIHRDVWLLRAGRINLAPGGLSVRTPEIDDDGAVVTVIAEVRNQSTTSDVSTLRVEVINADGAVVATDAAPVTSFPGDELRVRRRLFVRSPHRWGLDDPYLYKCRASLLTDDVLQDEDTTTFGIRSLAVDAQRGLRINGEPVLLRGACVHHDNGPLGAASFGRAEERRIQLLREAGFNAIRSAHNPLSRGMLAACDRLGVLVMDEAFDIWAQSKSEDDYSLRFADWWEADIEAMVRNSQNHP
ncbi:MAG: glycoside hydrolase family 2 TIM barrel-domain containing protein, partial [Acidimicrobiales bacterium]